jgi:hypothetical protein
VAKVKASKSDARSNSESELEKGRWIIDAKSTAAIATSTKVHLDELDQIEEDERLFHSQMWVKGTPMHVIVDSGS